MFRTFAGSVALVLALAAPAYAQDKAPSKERVKSCNEQAAKRALKGRERQSFMGDCVSGGASKDKKRKSAKP